MKWKRKKYILTKEKKKNSGRARKKHSFVCFDFFRSFALYFYRRKKVHLSRLSLALFKTWKFCNTHVPNVICSGTRCFWSFLLSLKPNDRLFATTFVRYIFTASQQWFGHKKTHTHAHLGIDRLNEKESLLVFGREICFSVLEWHAFVHRRRRVKGLPTREGIKMTKGKLQEQE